MLTHADHGNRSLWPQTETATTETAINRNGHKLKRPQTEMAREKNRYD